MPETTAPFGRVEQRDAALEKANRVRSGAAAIKREIREGELAVIDALDDPRAAPIEIVDLLDAQRSVGDSKVRSLLARCRVPGNTRVRDLSPRQRVVILQALSPGDRRPTLQRPAVAPAQPSRRGRVQHRVSTKVRAMELAAAGMGPAEIIRQLVAEGVDPPPAHATISRWTDDNYDAQRAERVNATMRERRLKRARMSWPGVRGPEWKLARMRILARGGLDDQAIAVVMNTDFPADQITPEAVGVALSSGMPPRAHRAYETATDQENAA